MVWCTVSSYCGCVSLEKGARSIAIGELVLFVLVVIDSIVRVNVVNIISGVIGMLFSFLLLGGVRYNINIF